MRTLVLGGIRSGKSRWAEDALMGEVADGAALRYVATGPTPDDDTDWAARVAAHRERRQHRWATVESADVAAQLRADPVPTLVDDAGAWLTATMDRSGAWHGAAVTAQTDDLVDAVGAFAVPLVIVSPEVGLTVVPASAAGRRFADELGTLNQRLAGVCERVVLVIAGQAVSVKEPV
ncbi:bifunctional adenosylcobinamide kinase/adenosylcobinamide-phosphate guanylyltransferase [Mycobacterium sp. IDR2000157661]|uniref:bifunctional adenosylcobinamide kinase/adenosylcobinamide-phosphate guanylyltransferase n=1 Tax=Mycobacterium sp. IDR2000157661 TaxID=2867005 RepID=UPI001EEA69D9|nr:bifunctional adenosylcobinamide kinase/adenosylcobinamide-phosphate guanylyltransferase [Mycobacterium sp. IDR2000157661]ULE32088.1 bifunctional adenosylcobinamide kinase/adenosylcobinamide-phosphate guanylyltransferase [Mycobacterium sp. IDR2000157661]